MNKDYVQPPPPFEDALLGHVPFDLRAAIWFHAFVDGLTRLLRINDNLIRLGLADGAGIPRSASRP